MTQNWWSLKGVKRKISLKPLSRWGSRWLQSKNLVFGLLIKQQKVKKALIGVNSCKREIHSQMWLKSICNSNHCRKRDPLESFLSTVTKIRIVNLLKGSIWNQKLKCLPRLVSRKAMKKFLSKVLNFDLFRIKNSIKAIRSSLS